MVGLLNNKMFGLTYHIFNFENKSFEKKNWASNIFKFILKFLAKKKKFK